MELAASPTSIDHTKSTRTVPMSCLVLGAGRTGKNSICRALTILGLNHVYHMDSALNNPPNNDLWLRVLAAKYPDQRHQESAFDRKEWDLLLGYCQAVTNFPVVIFAKELIEAYLEAKVVITNPNVDSWYESILRTIDWSYHDPGLYLISLISPTTSKYASMFYETLFHFSNGNFRAHGKQAFIEHYDTIRSLVPPERLLEYEVRDGWGPLCEFLELERPKEEFTSGNDKGDFKVLVRQLDWMRVKEAMWQNRWTVAVVVVTAAGLRYFLT